MIQAELFRILGYAWAAFGAYWMGFGLLRKIPTPGEGRNSSGRLPRFGFLAITFVILFVERHRIPPVALIVLALIWSALGLYWAASSGPGKSSGEFRFYRPLRLLILATTFALLFWRGTAIGFLGAQFISPIPGVAITGFAAALVGMGIASWARIHLGKFWSDKVVLQSGHELVRTGPYARMRHPIYSGVLLGVLGTAILLGEWRGLVAFALLLANYAIKARKEEQLLEAQFGPGFNQHARRTGFLLPRLRGPSTAETGPRVNG